MSWREIKVDHLARVEGEAAFNIRVRGNEVKEVTLNVYEPARFFESFLVGKRWDEVHELASRICGICYTAHQITALRAIENSLGVEVSEQTSKLRDLLTLGGMLQSHSLHLYFLALPDYLGYESALAMANDYPKVVKRGLKLKQLANQLQTLIGGRAVHPVTTRVGGFTSLPDESDLKKFCSELKEVKEDALETVRIFKGLKIPDFERRCEHVALKSESSYPLNSGKLSSTGGLSCEESDYRKCIEEKQIPPSHAKYSTLKGRSSFLVGPLARMNLNFDRVCKESKEVTKEIGVKFPNFNPFVNNIARAIEVVQYLHDAIDIIENIKIREEEPKAIKVRPGKGCAITEAPRGILYHYYELDKKGLVSKADVVTPTAHNVLNIEKDLAAFSPFLLDLPRAKAQFECEKLIRAYDPCFSCSVHLIKVNAS
jgi:coenzyme F420-reducing hydrogenase alpha subunit